MIRISIKDLLGRKLRLALTSLAIVMGVAMVSGTFILTDTINAAFTQIFSTAYSNSDAVVTGKEEFGGSTNAPSFSQTTLTKIKALPQVADATGGISDTAQYVKANGKVLSTGGAPGLAFGVDVADRRFSSVALTSGQWPTGADDVAVDQTTASTLHLTPGSAVKLVPDGRPASAFKVSGIVKFGNSTSLGGATLAIFDLSTAQQLFHKQGQLDEIDADAATGTSSQQLIDAIQGVLPAHTQVLTGTEEAKQQSDDVENGISFLRYFLLAFGGIALFVGAFVIANTLSITVAQRTREFATLRSMGASGSQIRRVVVVEGLVTGFVASVIGLFVGYGLAAGLRALFEASGAKLPSAGLVFASRTVIFSLVLGTVVTVLASLRPAVRATRVPPIAAVREGSILPPSRFARFGPAASIGVCVVAIALVVYGAFGHGGTGPRLLGLGVGVLLLFVGVAMVAPMLVRPLASVLGWPASRAGGVAGTLARANSMRNPGRTASTAAALMIGLTLVTIIAVLASGLRASFEDAFNTEFDADYALTSQNGFIPTSAASATALRASGVASLVVGVRAGDGAAYGKTLTVTAVDPHASTVLHLKWTQGGDADLDSLGASGAVVDKGYAKDHALTLGSPIRMETPAGKFLDLNVKAIFDPPNGGSPLGTITISTARFDASYTDPQNVFTFVDIPGGVTDANTAKLNHVLAGYPDAKIQTGKEFVKSQEDQINSFLILLYILLALSIVVSLFGIVNTLILTVFERTREIGMLRAVGMTRRQTRRMIRQEAIVTALIGAALGIPLGMVLAALFGKAIGGVPFKVPVGSVVIFVIAAIIVGLLAAIFPARRAAKLNVLEALQYE